MFKSTEDMLRYLDLAGWSERRDLEFKEGKKWDGLKPKLAKGALALSNIEGGGYIIIGIGKGRDDMFHKPKGMPREDALTYDLDKISDYINAFADPPIDIEVQHFGKGGRFFVVIKVHEFAAEPVICKKDHNDIRRGILYYRGRRMPQSAPVASSAEMREIVDRAVDKAFKRQHKRLQSYPPQKTDPFADEEKEEYPIETKKIMGDVQGRGYWEIRIRPATYPDTPLGLPMLESALLKSKVQYRGLPYPHGPESPRGELYHLNGCVESRVRWGTFAGVVRLYASGQFVHYMAMFEDEPGRARRAPAEEYPPGAPRRPPERAFMYFASALYYLTEIYMFASKIAQEGVLGDDIVIEITLHGQEGRVLKSETVPFMFTDSDRCRTPTIRLGPHRVTAESLRVGHDDMAVRDAAVLLEKYNVADDAVEILRRWQEDFYQRRG